jgi:7-cyano-7-deazaguanine synthase
MQRLSVVLLSGGLDSTTVAAWSRSRGGETLALTFTYGQTHEREVEAAAAVARALAIRHQTVNLGFFKDLAWYSALTHADRFQIPSGRSVDQMGADIPITYIPFRNTLFLTVAAAALESRVLEAVESQGVSPRDLDPIILIGANALDYSGYPDCRPEYYDALRRTLRLGSKLGTQYELEVRIETPLIDKTKAEIIQLALELGAPLECSWSCYVGGERPCGDCDSCLLRAKGFAEVGLLDPALAPR